MNLKPLYRDPGSFMFRVVTWEEVYGVVVEGGGDRGHSKGDERHEDLQEGEGGPELLRTEQDGELGPDNDRLHSSQHVGQRTEMGTERAENNLMEKYFS